MQRSAASRAGVDVNHRISAEHAHDHSGVGPPALVGRQRRRVVVLLTFLVVPLCVATAVGVGWLWPREHHLTLRRYGRPLSTMHRRGPRRWRG